MLFFKEDFEVLRGVWFDPEGGGANCGRWGSGPLLTGQPEPSHHFQSAVAIASSVLQSSGGLPRFSIFRNTAFGRVALPADRRGFLSLTQAKIMILIFESKRKNKRKLYPTFARGQCRNDGPIVLPCR